MSIGDQINLYGVELIQHLQTKFPRRGNFFMSVSDIGDPTLMCTFYFPLATALSPYLGVTLMWTFVFCEWTNMVLKLLLAGDRPFWWIHETPLFKNQRPPMIQQFPRTCETGAGNPSGHATLNAAIFFVFVSFFVMRIKRSSFISKQTRPMVVKSLWGVYIMWCVMVCVSRTYIAAHFPHQCVLGVLIGIFTAYLVKKTSSLYRPSVIQSLALSTSIVVSVLSIFALYSKVFGFDPMWSMEKAIKWCIRREYIHIDSIPFYSLTRYSGMSLGLGIALTTKYYTKVDRIRFTKLMTLSVAILTLCLGQLSSFLHKEILDPSLTAYYFLEFAMNTIITFSIVALIPAFVAKVNGSKYKKS